MNADNDLTRRQKEIQELYDFVVEQVMAGLYKSDIIEKLIEMGVDKNLASELVEEMEEQLKRMRKKSVLIIMDDSKEKDMLKKELRIVGYRVFEVNDGKKALDRLINSVPQLIILEHPFVAGYQFIKKLRADPIGRKIPVFVIGERKAMKDAFTSLGLTEFVAKPMNINNLVTKIKKMILIPRKAWEI